MGTEKQIALLTNPDVVELAKEAFNFAIIQKCAIGEFHKWVETKHKEGWSPIVVGIGDNNAGKFFIVNHTTFPSERDALAYKPSGLWEVSHAVKVWPKEK